MKVLLGIHDDDLHLFSCFSAIRTAALAVICMDSHIQPNRGEQGCGPEERAAETAAACAITGNEVLRLGLRDDTVTQEQIEEKFLALRDTLPITEIYGPALHAEGNVHHNMVAIAADRVWGTAVKRYTSYSRHNLYETGDVEIVPTAEELELKEKALACYVSQLRINGAHFEAVRGKSEWLLA